MITLDILDEERAATEPRYRSIVKCQRLSAFELFEHLGNRRFGGQTEVSASFVPEGLRYSPEKVYWNPRKIKTFNVIETLKADSSMMAGHLSESWNTFAIWLQGTAQ